MSDHKKASSLADRIHDREKLNFRITNADDLFLSPPSIVSSSVNAPSWPEVQLELNRFRSCNHWKPLANYYWSRSHSIITVRPVYRPPFLSTNKLHRHGEPYPPRHSYASSLSEHVEPSNPNLSISEPLTSADLRKKMGRRRRPWTDPDNFRRNFRGIREVESHEKSCGLFSEANKRRKIRTPNLVSRIRGPLNIYRHSASGTCTLILAADDLVDFSVGIINPELVAGNVRCFLSVFTRNAMNLRDI